MWEISEVVTKFIYLMTKLVSPKDLGNIAHLGIYH